MVRFVFLLCIKWQTRGYAWVMFTMEVPTTYTRIKLWLKQRTLCTTYLWMNANHSNGFLCVCHCRVIQLKSASKVPESFEKRDSWAHELSAKATPFNWKNTCSVQCTKRNQLPFISAYLYAMHAFNFILVHTQNQNKNKMDWFYIQDRCRRRSQWLYYEHG